MGDTSHSQSVTTADLDRWEALAESATEGPWRADEADEFGDHNIVPPLPVRLAVAAVVKNLRPADEVAANADLVAESRLALPRLIARVRLLEEVLREIDDELDQRADIDDHGGPNQAMEILAVVRNAAGGCYVPGERGRHLLVAETALKQIAVGDGVYGAQAAEYKAIAREALQDIKS